MVCGTHHIIYSVFFRRPVDRGDFEVHQDTKTGEENVRS